MTTYRDKQIKPTSAEPDFAAIPAYVQSLNQWVLWRYDWVERKAGTGEWSKVPCNAWNGRLASTTDPATWSGFDLVVAAFYRNKNKYAGIGFVFSKQDDLCGIDFDNCIVAGEGEHLLSPDATYWIDVLSTYTEVSPSGTGLHAIVKASVMAGRKDHRSGIEMYDTSRYFTFTGRSWHERPLQIADRQQVVNQMWAEVFGQKTEIKERPVPIEPTQGVTELLGIAFKAQNGAKIKRLFDGDCSDYSNDQSAADLALCSLLAFYTGGSESVLDEMFRASSLMRKKWDVRHYGDGRTYGEEVLHKAIISCAEFYSPTIKTKLELVTTPTKSHVRQVKDYRDDLDELYQKGYQPGVSTGWGCVDDLYTVKAGQWTVITGEPSAGKSVWLNALLVNLACLHDWKFVICSPEFTPVATHVAELISLYSGKPFMPGPTPQIDLVSAREAEQWVDEHFRFIDTLESSLTMDYVLQVASEIHSEWPVNGLILDPFTEFEQDRERGETETDYIKRKLTQFIRFIRGEMIHGWIVAHPQKLQRAKGGSYPIPTLYDINGCYSEDTEVLTFGGWKLHNEVQKGEKIACFNLADSMVKWYEPAHLTSVDYEGEMYQFKGRSIDCLVTPNHRMVVRPGWVHEPKDKSDARLLSREWQFIRADELGESGWLTPYAANFVSFFDTVFIPELPEIQTVGAVDDFLRFLGWWISEGCVQMGGLHLCQSQGELADEMEDCLNRLGLHHRIYADSSRPHEKPMYKARVYARSHPEFSRWVSSECKEGALNKQLPDITWVLSNRQKRILLDALVDGDGSRYENGNVKYATTSKQLADDVQRLALELGLPVALGCADGAELHHGPRFTVYIGKPSRTFISLRIHRQLNKVSYKGKVHCFTVPTGSYITRRNGRISFHGNSAHWRNKAHMGITLHRPDDKLNKVEVHVQKVKFRWCGKIGQAELWYDKVTGRYSEREADDLRW